MPKVQTTCATCGGSFDGTPSGKAKHDGTGKHQLAARLAAKVTKPTKAVVSKAEPDPVTSDNGVLPQGATSAALAEIDAGLTALITVREERLAYGQKAVKRRERRGQPDIARQYYTEKVAPLREEIALLRAARKALSDA